MKILLTAAGYQGAYNLVKFLEKKGFQVIGTDVNPNTAARFYCSKCYQVAEGTAKGFMPDLMKILVKEKPDVIIPGSSRDVLALSLAEKQLNGLGVKVLVSGAKETKTCLNKGETYNALKGIIDLPEYVYSKTGLVVKPENGKGGKGVKYLEEKFAMERLKGEEIDVDVLSDGKELLVAECKTRERAYGGVLMEGQIVQRPEIVSQIKKILEVIPLRYMSVFQFIGGKLLEINPRIAGAVIDQKLPYLAIKYALGETTKEILKRYKIPYNKRIAKYTTHYES